MKGDVYSNRDRLAYEPPWCEVCGAQFQVDWVNVLTVDQDPDGLDTPQWVLGRLECANDPSHPPPDRDTLP